MVLVVVLKKAMINLHYYYTWLTADQKSIHLVSGWTAYFYRLSFDISLKITLRRGPASQRNNNKNTFSAYF